MKIFVGLFILFFSFNSLFASPLIYKSVKTSKAFEYAEFGAFDADKYKQIRIRVNVEKQTEEDKGIREVQVFAVEDGKQMMIASGGFSQVIDSPPSRIAVRVVGGGSYTLYVWASE